MLNRSNASAYLVLIFLALFSCLNFCFAANNVYGTASEVTINLNQWNGAEFKRAWICGKLYPYDQHQMDFNYIDLTSNCKQMSDPAHLTNAQFKFSEDDIGKGNAGALLP